MAPLPPLATVAELETWLQVEAGTAPQGAAALALDVASGLVRGEARCPFTERESTASLPVVDGRITPAGPVLDVLSVTVAGEVLPASQWSLEDGTVTLAAHVLRSYPRRATVQWRHGYTQIPADVKGIVLDAVARAIVNPRYLRQESTGQRALTFATESFTVSLSEIEKDKLQRYRPGARLGPMGRISGGSRVW
ncbi:hypothetical protein [Streptomyces sp. DHE17-7]|uniref:hypothetical protein n=1 Tax=Streptomyces sp. DHE17-7 TaxID=2759949 RepID=UPI000EC14E83|nr:hypothetical protein [Streptomyces sp. DHE17-7]MBJ6623651.1 hypothetical protein [Streptomyces sp. DHE17-7]RIH58386.1 hypothetical protein D3C59_35445 [Streptomyces sp. SHP22-7]